MKSNIAQKTADVIIHYLTRGEYDIRKSEQRKTHLTATINVQLRPDWISNKDLRRIQQENEKELLNEAFNLLSSILNKQK